MCREIHAVVTHIVHYRLLAIDNREHIEVGMTYCQPQHCLDSPGSCPDYGANIVGENCGETTWNDTPCRLLTGYSRFPLRQSSGANSRFDIMSRTKKDGTDNRLGPIGLYPFANMTVSLDDSDLSGRLHVKVHLLWKEHQILGEGILVASVATLR